MRLKEWKVSIDMGESHNPMIALVKTSPSGTKGTAFNKAAIKKFGRKNAPKALMFNKFSVVSTKIVEA
jgi:hypothetical protein